MKNSTRYDVCAFCARHGVVLDTLLDWRPMDPEYIYTHRLFGEVVSGITDGIVCWTYHTDNAVRFVHLDMCTAERLPNLTFVRPTRTKGHAPRNYVRPVKDVRQRLDELLADIDY